MPYKIAYVTGGGFPDTDYTFDNETTGFEWLNDTRALKNTMDAIKASEAFTSNSNNMNALAAVFAPWLASVASHTTKWGKEFVTPDIRWAVNDVERNLGHPETEWN